MIAAAVRRAGWLPGLRDSDVIEWQRLRFPRLDVEIPRLTAEALGAQLERIQNARDAYLTRYPSGVFRASVSRRCSAP